MKNTKSTYIIYLLSIILVLSLSNMTIAQRGDDVKRKSKNGKAEGTIDGVKVTVEYGRPKVDGRIIWGGLVPYDKLWRTGADEATNITFSHDVTVEGKRFPKGTYALFTIPGKDEWTIVFNKVAKQWGGFKYDKGQDALRVKVKAVENEHVEEMTFKISGNKVILEWEKLFVPFVIGAAK